jgi:hypothetical protein
MYYFLIIILVIADVLMSALLYPSKMISKSASRMFWAFHILIVLAVLIGIVYYVNGWTLGNFD